MIFRSLLLVLLVLTCLQSLTTAENGNAPEECCFTYQKNPIPVRLIAKYKVTGRDCTNAGVIFMLKNSRRVCADPGVQWVKYNMGKIEQRLNSQD